MAIEKSIESFVKYLEHERNYSPLTIENYRRDLSQFVDFYRDFYNYTTVLPKDITKKSIRHFAGMLNETGLKNSTISRKVAAIKSFFKFLISESVIKKNPAAGIKSPKTEKKLPVIISTEKIVKALGRFKRDNFQDTRNRLIIELFYSTGIRLGELVNISMQDIDTRRGRIRIYGKGSKERIVPFGRLVAEAMNNYQVKRIEKFGKFKQQAPLFLSNRGKRLSRQMVQVIVKKILEEVSEQLHLSPHVLRHSFATHMLDRGAELLAVKEILGHESLSTTQLYTHLQTNQLQALYKKAHPHG